MCRIVIDTSTYKMNNIGDMAMLLTTVQRLKDLFGSPRFHILTNDPEGIRNLIPDARSLNVGTRLDWSIFSHLPRPDVLRERFSEVEAALRWNSFDEVQARIRQRADNRTAQGFTEFYQIMENADLVLTMGGGFFSDNFAEHAVGLLETLAEARCRNKPAIMLGTGFEPVENALLNTKARAVLPNLNLISCREGLTSPNILSSFGVIPERIRVTGDDAVEMAYSARAADLGHGIGVNLRIAPYAGTDSFTIDRIRPLLHAAARKCGTTFIPISVYEPSDSSAIKQLLAGFDDQSDGGETLQTPEQIFRQLHPCRIMFTGSYHGAVFALSQGIPTISLAKSLHYQTKMTGLMAQFGFDGTVLDPDDPALPEKLAFAIEETWNKADQLRHSLLDAAKRQIQDSRFTYKQIYEIVKQYPPQSQETMSSRTGRKIPDELETETWFLLSDAIHALAKQAAFYRHHADERLQVIKQLSHAAQERLELIERLSKEIDRLLNDT
jgi:polysaccharide pyruvyl transferase WcaK-like protein